MDKDKAKAEWLKKEIDAFRGNELSSYIGEEDISHSLANGVSEGELISYFKETFGQEIDPDDYYEMSVPSKATDEQIEGLIKLMSLRFFKLHEITITE